MTAILLLLTGLLVPLGQEGGAGPKIAVVDVPAVSEQYQKTADLEAHFEAIRRRLSERRDALRDGVELTQRSLQEELKPGTKEFQARRKKLALQEAGPEVTRLTAQTSGGVEIVVLLLHKEADQLSAFLPDLARHSVGAAQQEVLPTREERVAVLAAHGHGNACSYERNQASLPEAARQGLRDVHWR